MQRSVLVTGFGPFPGAPFNPTGALVRALARRRRPALGDVRMIAHEFETSYAAVDRDLPALLAREQPDAVVMFGLAARTRFVRIETRARNVRSVLLPDVAGGIGGRTIRAGGPPALTSPIPASGLLHAGRLARVPCRASRDAGRYLCNYAYWHALEAAAISGGPRIAVFVHVPRVPRQRGRKGRPWKPRVSMADLLRAGEAIVLAVAQHIGRGRGAVPGRDKLLA